jgi:phospholipid/cholesterol/gamma-HCH transport system ATP-binding protein
MNSVMEIGDKVVFIYQGKKLWEGTNKEILHTDSLELNEFVFATSLAQRLKKSDS